MWAVISGSLDSVLDALARTVLQIAFAIVRMTSSESV